MAKAPNEGVSGDVIRRVNDQAKLVREFDRTNNIRIKESREGKLLALSYVLY